MISLRSLRAPARGGSVLGALWRSGLLRAGLLLPLGATVILFVVHLFEWYIGVQLLWVFLNSAELIRP